MKALLVVYMFAKIGSSGMGGVDVTPLPSMEACHFAKSAVTHKIREGIIGSVSARELERIKTGSFRVFCVPIVE